MGNIARATIPDGFDPPDLRKGICSIFANLAVASLAAKRAEVQSYRDDHGGDPGGFNAVMFGVIPLFTWGPQQTATEYEWDFASTITIDTFSGGTTDVPLSLVGGSHSSETPPSFIGVFVGSTSSPVLQLIVHIQTQVFASCSNTLNSVEGAHWEPPGEPLGAVVLEYADASYIDEAKQEYFGNAAIRPNDGSSGAAFGRPDIAAGAEVTFSAIVSWDVTAGCAVHGVAPDAEEEIGTSAGTDTASKMWCAIDGVNKNGYDLPAMWAHDDTGSGDPNEMLSFISASVSGNYGSTLGTPSVTLTTSATSVPFYPISIPSPLSLNREGTPIVPNPVVRVGRLQFFADPLISAVNLDLSNPDNVEAFRNTDGTPALLSAARTRLGVSPLIEFATATAMINGTNSGTAGSLAKTGTVTAFTP